MYQKILVPVDLAHVERLQKALTTAADLAGHYRIPVCYVGVTGVAPGAAAHDPGEFSRRLQAFVDEQQSQHGLDASMVSCVAHDPSVELDATLLQALQDSGADLLVMASHVPGLADHLFASHASHMVTHSSVSVFVVR